MPTPKRTGPLRTLVLPDIHHRTKLADAIIKKETAIAPVDEIVFLGDYFDDFGDGTKHATRTATWVKQKLRQPTNILLYGNHDLAYAFPTNSNLRCSGFTKEKADAIKEVLKPVDWKKMRLYYYSQGWLMSHAGLHPTMLNPFCEPLEALETLANEAVEAIKIGGQTALTGAGYARGGCQKVGGITWLDFHREFKPIDGINQLVGHTPSHSILDCLAPRSRNYAIDVLGAYVLIVNGNPEFKFWKYPKLL